MEPRKTPELVRDAARGAAVSLVASTAMGAFMKFTSDVGALGEPPPRRLTRQLLSAAGIHMMKPAMDVTTNVLHLGYGGIVGALSGPWLQRMPTRRARTLAGAAIGGVVWAVSYAGWIPSIGWMARPSRDVPRARPWMMFAAHLIFGGILGALQRPATSPPLT